MKSQSAKAKPDPPAPEADAGPGLSPEFELARARWNDLRLKMRQLDRRREQLQTAIFLAGSPSGNQAAQRLVAEIDPSIIALVRRSARRAQLELENLIDEIVEAQPGYGAEHELFEAAKRAEATRIAELFADRHRLAILELVGALESFNRAIEMERAVRRDYAKASPEPVSVALPDLSSDFDELDLAQWHSVGAAWARRVRAGGFAS